MDSDLHAEVAAGVEPPAALTEQTALAVEHPPVVEEATQPEPEAEAHVDAAHDFERLTVRSARMLPGDDAVVGIDFPAGSWYFYSGDDVHAFVTELLAAARDAFGNHNGLYVEKVG